MHNGCVLHRFHVAFVCCIGCVGSGASQRVYPDRYWKLRQNSNLKGMAFVLCETTTLNYIITILLRRVWRRHPEPLFFRVVLILQS